MPRDYGFQKRMEDVEARVDGLEDALFDLIKKFENRFPAKKKKEETILGIRVKSRET